MNAASSAAFRCPQLAQIGLSTPNTALAAAHRRDRRHRRPSRTDRTDPNEGYPSDLWTEPLSSHYSVDRSYGFQSKQRLLVAEPTA